MVVAFNGAALLPVLMAFKFLGKNHLVPKVDLYLLYECSIKYSVIVALLDLVAINFKF